MNVLIYAVGGGHGHTMRGAALAERLWREGCRCRMLIREGSDRYLDPQAHVEIARFAANLDYSSFDCLVVDTFPRGWTGELTPAFISRFAKRIFLARHRRDLVLQDLNIYDEIWDPAPAGYSEWTSLVRARPVGWLVRKDRYSFEEARGVLLILDPSNRLGNLALNFKLVAERCGWKVEFRNEIPQVLRAEKVLIVGAGYNTFYETWDFHDRIRFIPLGKRYDDQRHRARGKSIASLDEWARWVIPAGG